MAALKLNLEPDTRLNWILPRLAVEHEATGMRDQQVLEDPGQSGLEDARAGLARTYYVPGMDRMRRPEGLLHAAYWVGKSGDRIKIEPYTMDEFRRLSPTAILEFFNDPEKGVAIRRRNYVLSTLRVKDGRDPLRVIEMLRQADALPKLFPGMDKVLGDADKWARATARVRRLNAHVRRSLKGQDIRQAREQVVAALLSEVDDIEKALSIYQWSKAPRGDDFNKHRIITAWKWFRTSDPNPVAPDPSPSEQPAPQD
jgi:hypothetical protein